MEAFLTSLFVKFNPLKYPGLAVFVASTATTAEDVFIPLTITVFLTVVFKTGVVPVDETLITLGVVMLVFVIVKSLEVPPTVLEPSTIILFPLTTNRALVSIAPVMVDVTPVAGLIVKV